MHNVLIDFGFFQIYWYSIFIFFAILVGGYLVLRESKKWNIPEDFMINLFFFMIPIAIIGARLYYVAFEWDYYMQNPLDIFKVWEGGLAIHGGLLFGFLWIVFYSRKYKVNTWRLLDMIVVGLLIGQAIGRWGNFANGEAFGPVVSLEFLQGLHLPQFIIDGMYIDGVYHQPTFLYESLWCLIGFVGLLVIRKYRYLKVGQLTGVYLMWYSVGRFFIEGLRTDSLMFFNFRIAQIVSLVLFALGLFLVLKRGRGSKFDRQYHDKENVDEVNF